MVDDRSDTANRTSDVVIVGGGPAGCAVAISTARYGLHTVLFDRGNSALRRCAFLENYLGFPAGIDLQTFYELMHDHVERAGCELVSDMVESVTQRDCRFRVDTQEGRTIDTPRVVVATTYDREYLRGLDDEDRMFETHGHGDGEHEHFNREYVDDDGRTPIDGLYVAGALGGNGTQALTAAGHGTTVGMELVSDVRREQGYWEQAAVYRDWRWRRAAIDHDWDDENAWHQRFAKHRLPEDHDIETERLQEVRDREIAEVKSAHLDRDEIERRTERAQRHLAEYLDDELLLDVVGEDNLQEYVVETKGWKCETDD